MFFLYHRVLDGVPATIDALPGMVKAVEAVGGGIEVYMDGGIRTGMDAFKALAMGELSPSAAESLFFYPV